MFFPFVIAKSIFGLSSCLPFARGATLSSPMSSLHKKTSRGREQVELLLDVTPYMIFDDGIWVGMNKNTCVIATDVT